MKLGGLASWWHAVEQRVSQPEASATPTTGRGRLLDGSQQRAGHDGDENGKLPARRRPTPGQSRLPNGGQQIADDDDDEACELPARRLLTPGRGWLQDCSLSPKSADDDDVEAGRASSPRATAGRPIPGRSWLSGCGPGAGPMTAAAASVAGGPRAPGGSGARLYRSSSRAASACAARLATVPGAWRSAVRGPCVLVHVLPSEWRCRHHRHCRQRLLHRTQCLQPRDTLTRLVSAQA